MKRNIKATQGFTFNIRVSDFSSTLVITDGLNKYILDNVITIAGEYYIEALPDVTKTWAPRKIHISTSKSVWNCRTRLY